MTKIMLVEDDKSLREIYGVRLLAEGYDIVSAGDGEEALAMAIKERPKLIITDVMMPKISGFDMLDILRSTTETRDIKVIMMTALSSDDQRARGEQMGADRYLVKSQVGIEDVVRVVHDVLGDGGAPKVAAAAAPAAMPPTTAPAPPPRAPVPPASATIAAPHPAAPAPHPMPPVSSVTPAPPSARQRIIQPISNPAQKIDINELLDRELAREAGNGVSVAPQVPTAAQEKATVQSQINAFSGVQSTPPTAPAAPKPAAPQTQQSQHPAQPQPQQLPAQPRPTQVPQRPVTPPQTPNPQQPPATPPQAPPAL
ncbi:MAG TPA: response regulator [Candidatus Saccharimonas sp.]|nr:response regulator [Candidatus Saccharimonas sp.]